MEKNGSIRKVRLISKFATSQPGKQTVEIHTLPNISRSKGNQSVVRIKYEDTFFLKNHKQHVVEKLFPNPSLKLESISLDQ